MSCVTCQRMNAKVAWAEAELASIARRAAAKQTPRLLTLVTQARANRDVQRQAKADHEAECFSDAETALAQCPTPAVTSSSVGPKPTLVALGGSR